MNERNDGHSWLGSLTDLAVQAPHFYELANTVGQFRRRRRAEHIARRLGWLGAGALVGAGVAALVTPKSGAEIRRRISDQAGRVRDYVAGSISEGADEGADEKARTKK